MNIKENTPNFNTYVLDHYKFEKKGTSAYRLQSLEGDLDSLHVNGQILKRYFT